MKIQLPDVDAIQDYRRWQIITSLDTVRISTVNLPLDHGFGGTPIWYETMVFPHGDAEDTVESYLNLDCERYETQEEAEKGHELMVEKWREEEKNSAD